jgi:IS30 family transposase
MSQFINGKPQDGMTGVSAELNDRPRKALGWKTPAEAFQQLLSAGTKRPGVATID